VPRRWIVLPLELNAQGQDVIEMSIQSRTGLPEIRFAVMLPNRLVGVCVRTTDSEPDAASAPVEAAAY